MVRHLNQGVPIVTVIMGQRAGEAACHGQLWGILYLNSVSPVCHQWVTTPVQLKIASLAYGKHTKKTKIMFMFGIVFLSQPCLRGLLFLPCWHLSVTQMSSVYSLLTPVSVRPIPTHSTVASPQREL